MGFELEVKHAARILTRIDSALDEVEEFLAEGAGMDELREAREQMQLLESTLDDIGELPLAEHGAALKECLEFGLVTIEAKYGLRSLESKAVTETINAL